MGLRNLVNKIFFGFSTDRIEELTTVYPVHKDGNPQHFQRSLKFWDRIDRDLPVESPPVYTNGNGVFYTRPIEVLCSEKGKAGLKKFKKRDFGPLSP